MTHLVGEKEKPRFLSPNMGHKNMGAYQLSKNLEKIYARDKLSPIPNNTFTSAFVTPQN
jgi:hypothetical protein